MGFKENLKSELQFRNMTVKELSALSGIKKQTLDNYLGAHNSIPSVEAGVRIAQALNVSVEYLVTGQSSLSQTESDKQFRILKTIFFDLNSQQRQLLIDISQVIKKTTNSSVSQQDF